MDELFSFRSNSRSLVRDTDLARWEIVRLMELTDALRRLPNAEARTLLDGKVLGMIFEKSSTRTRVSFEVGMIHMGGHAIHLDSSAMQIGRGESLEDTAEVLSRYVDGLMIRSKSQEHVEQLANYSRVPVINGLSDVYHPCQALSDYYTMRSFSLQARSVCFYGDAANNVAISLALTGSRLGYDMTFCAPEKYRLPEWVVQEINNASESASGSVTIESDPYKAVKGCDFLYTDVWISMGQEGEAETRRRDLRPYALNRDLLAHADKKPYIMHCLPAKWGDEMDLDLKDYHKNIIFDQAENRLHMQKSILLALLGE